MSSPFRIAVINDEISQDFGHACEVATKEFGMEWIELRGMWNKNILRLDANEVAEARKILEKYKLRVTDIASPLFKVDWPGAPLSKFSPKRDQFNADFTFDQQPEVLERSIALAKAFSTERVRLFDFWRLDDQKPYREAIDAKLREAAATAAKDKIILVLENEMACNTGDRSGSRESARRRSRNELHGELGSGKRRRSRRNAVSRRIQAAAEGAHRTLPLQERDAQSRRQRIRLGAGRNRHRRLERSVRGAEARRISLRREPRDALARRGHAGGIDAAELDGNERGAASGRRVLTRTAA